MAPSPWWWPRANNPPEVVAEAETEIGPDGTLAVEIDTELAQEMHGDQDHRYEITAEVVDESRRTIVGKGEVLVAREPFKVFAWVNRGHFKTGDAVSAEFQAQTGFTYWGNGQLFLGEPRKKPVSGRGGRDFWNS